MPKGSSKCVTYNPNARVSQNISIVKDLSQIPYAMSMLEVLQSCPIESNYFLTMIGAVDPNNYMVVTFHMSNFKTRLPHCWAMENVCFPS